jgi:salicylate hydroxylase
MSKAPLKISIVGAGLGGLAAAIALSARGFEVRVFEQAPELGEVGAGVQLAPNATRVLNALGLQQEIMKTAFEPERHAVVNWKTGKVTAATQMKGVYEKQFGARYLTFHRADLHAALLQAVPSKQITLNAKCRSVEDNGRSVVLRFEDGTEVESDLVIGADGIHSKVRESLYGPLAPRFTGVICWRGVVPVGAVPKDTISRDMGAWLGPRSTLVTYYLRRGELINWAAFYEGNEWREESWKTFANPDEVLRTYEAWHPSINTLISKTTQLYKWAVFERDPLPQWTKGRVTLLGDSSHPMLPYLAQGGCMAFEDAYVLAAALAKSPENVVGALKLYESLRLPRASKVQLASRNRGPINNVTSPIVRATRDIGYAVQKLINPSKHTYKVEWIYNYDATRAV